MNNSKNGGKEGGGSSSRCIGREVNGAGPTTWALARSLLGMSSFAMLGVSATMFSTTSLGAEWTLQSSVAAGVAQDDNPTLSTDDIASSASTQLAPRVELNRATERTEVNLDVGVYAKNYSNPDFEDTRRDTVSLSSFLEATERSRFALDADYRRDYLFESVTEDNGTGDLDDTDVGLSRVEVRREVRTLTPSWRYALSELSDMTLRYRETNVGFSGPDDVSLRDYANREVSGTYTRRVNIQNSLSVTVGRTRYRPELERNDSDTDRVLLGWTRAFTETANGRVQIGPTRTVQETSTGDAKTSGLAVDVGATQRSELTTLSAVVSHAVRGGGSGRAVQSNQVRVNLRRKLSDLTDFGLRLRAFENDTIEGTDSSADRTYVEVVPEYRWQLAPEWFFTGNLTYRRQKFDDEDKAAQSRAVFLGLVYGIGQTW